MYAKPRNFRKNWTSFLFVLMVAIVCFSCQADPKAQVKKSLEARENAINSRDIQAYLQLVSPDYKYKPATKMTMQQFMEEHLMFWDEVHIQTYNRLIYIDKKFARVSQDFQLSVQKQGKTKVFSGAEHFVLKQEGFFNSTWRFLEGLD